MNKYLYIQRFILKKENGNFRYSYFFPVTGIFIGTFIIFMIFSIMDSLGKQIDDRLNSFHYKYYLESKNITFKENFNNLLSFFYKLRNIGANINTENRKKSLIRFRKQKTNLSVFYNINFVLIKKL